MRPLLLALSLIAAPPEPAVDPVERDSVIYDQKLDMQMGQRAPALQRIWGDANDARRPLAECIWRIRHRI